MSFPIADFPNVYSAIKVVPHKARAWLLYDKEERLCTALKYNKMPVVGNDGLLNDLDGGCVHLCQDKRGCGAAYRGE